jgi:hypothetical protein
MLLPNFGSGKLVATRFLLGKSETDGGFRKSNGQWVDRPECKFHGIALPYGGVLKGYREQGRFSKLGSWPSMFLQVAGLHGILSNLPLGLIGPARQMTHRSIDFNSSGILSRSTFAIVGKVFWVSAAMITTLPLQARPGSTTISLR